MRLKNKLQTPALAGKKTGRRRAPDKDVISYLIIQSFEPGTINVLSESLCDQAAMPPRREQRPLLFPTHQCGLLGKAPLLLLSCIWG